MKKWLIALAIVLALLAGYVAAGPWLAIRGIHAAIESRDLDGLQRHVDFPTLRERLKGQVARRIGDAASDASGGIIGGDAGRHMVDQISSHAVNAMVSPTGISMLLQGRALAHRVAGNPDQAAANIADPLAQARTRYESPSRFTATLASAEGKPVVFVFERRGVSWKLRDIRLPD